MSEPQCSAADGKEPEEAACETQKNACETHAREASAVGDGAEAALGEGAFGEISGDEFLKEMLEAEEAAGLFPGGEGSAGQPGGAPPSGASSGGGAQPGGTREAGAESADLAARAEELEAQLAETREQLLRKAADFENFRKRTTQEKQKAIEFANESLLLDIIPVLDDFERAIASAEASPELADLPAGKAMLDGISMIEKRLTGQLESKWGLKRFSSAGEPFDPNFHEAMYMEKSPEAEEPVVAEDFAKGYMLKDRVLRAAKVKVLMPGEKES